MKKAIVLLAFAGLLAWLDARPAHAAERAQSLATLHVIDIKADHPKAYHPRIGDVAQCYLRFAVVPGQIVEDLEFKIEGKSVVRVGVVETTKRPGGGEISAFLYARAAGMSHVTFAPIPGHTFKPVRITFLAEKEGGKKPPKMGGPGRAKTRKTIAQSFKGLLYVKHGQVGSRSEGPLYFLQTYNASFLLEYQERYPWEPDYHLEFYCRRMVEVKGQPKDGVIHVGEIRAIPSPRIPKPNG